LTERQLEVLRLVANGNSNRDVARWLWIEPCSVQTLLKHAYRALGVDDRAHAVAVALRLGLLRLDEVTVPAALAASEAREANAA
jgi:DNA-binding NarL/FixJ family response regulator